METKRGKAEEMQRSQGDVMRLLAMMVTNTNTSLENLFLQKCSLLLLIIGRIIQTCWFSVLNLDLHLFVST